MTWNTVRSFAGYRGNAALLATLCLTSTMLMDSARADVSTYANCSFVADLSYCGNYYGGYSGERATVTADYGVIKARAEAHSSDGATSASAAAGALLSDTLIFRSPGLDGTSGQFSASLLVSYSMHNSIPTPAIMGAYGPLVTSSIYAKLSGLRASGYGYRETTFLDMMWTYPDQYGAHAYTDYLRAVDGGQVSSLPAPMILTETWDFVFGEPFTLRIQLDIGARAQAVYGSADIDTSHSAYWAGISSLTAYGVPVPFSVSSDSGTDWAMSFVPSIPEPSVLALTVAGAIVLGIAGRPRMSRTQAAGRIG